MIAAIVLAAGSSTRMGIPKPLVPLEGRPLLAHVLENLSRSSVEETIVVLGEASERIREEFPFAAGRTRVIVNPSFRDGMSTSLKAGIAALSPDVEAFFVVLGDEPFVEPQTYDALIAARRAQRTRIVLPTYRGVRGNPVLLDRSLAAEADAITGDRGCRVLHERHPHETLEVPVEDAGVLVDIDTPEELERARTVLQEHRPVSSLVTDLAPRDGKSEDAACPAVASAEPAPATLVLVGNDEVGGTLGTLGHLLGLRVLSAGEDLTDARRRGADEVVLDLDALPPKLTENCYAVVTAHAPYERRAVELLLRSPVAYIGWVASRRRTGPIKEALARDGFTVEQLGRIHNPAGLAIGAETPEEIALSVAAEVVRQIRSSDRSPASPKISG